MYSLMFRSAQQLVQNEEATCKILETLPRILYEILFKVAFRNNKTTLLQALVKTWPFPQLKVKMLLQTCHHHGHTFSDPCPDCHWRLPRTERSKNNLSAIITGVISHIRRDINNRSQQLPHRKLQQVDMTGLLGDKTWNMKLMSLWANAVAQAQTCITSQQNPLEPQGEANDQMVEESFSSTIAMEVPIELLVDLHVRFRSQEFIKKALENNANSLLHLNCQDLSIAYLGVVDIAEFLTFLDTSQLRRIELIHSLFGVMEVEMLMPRVTTFQNLKSLRLIRCSENTPWWLKPRLKISFNNFAAELSKLKHLEELIVCHFCLSNHLEYLLRGLTCSLQSLGLPFCNLTSKDISYLAQSHHSAHLIKLDLSGNNLTGELDTFLALLKSASVSLMGLNIAECNLEDTHFYRILSFLFYCTRLSHVGLYGNYLTSRSAMALLEQQHKLASLKRISFPIFLDCCNETPSRGLSPRAWESYINENEFQRVRDAILQAKPTFQYDHSSSFEMGDYFNIEK